MRLAKQLSSSQKQGYEKKDWVHSDECRVLPAWMIPLFIREGQDQSEETGGVSMAEAGAKEPTTIKKYANRRLYHTGTSSYVTLEDLALMVRQGEDFVVTDAKSGEDITRSVLGQIIFEQESKGQFLMPIAFLRQLIQFYGDNMQSLVPRYLEMSLASFMADQQKMRDQMAKSFGANPFNANAFGQNPIAAMEEQVRNNMNVFQEALRAFSPFSGFGAPSADKTADADKPKPKK